MLPILFIVFFLLYGFSLLLTKSIDQEDIDMLLTIRIKTYETCTFNKKIYVTFPVYYNFPFIFKTLIFSLSISFS
jgi:hypothetical protein